MSGPQLNTLPRIDAVWMAVSVDDDGSEGVCAVMVDGTWMPLLAADENRLADIKAAASNIAKQQNRLVRIVKMTTREEIANYDERVSNES